MFVEEYLRDLRRERYTPAAFARYVARSSGYARANIERNPGAVRSIVANAFGFFVLFLGLAIVAALVLDEDFAYRLIVYQGAAIAIGTTWLLLHVGLLRDAEGRPYSRIGLPNQLSFLRLLMIPTLYLCIVEGYLWLALVAYVFAGFSDVLDGFIARRWGPASRLGLVLDPIVDVGYVISIFAGLHVVGWIPSWIMTLVVIRYVLLFGGGTIVYLVRGRLRIRPTTFGRSSGILITGITFVLFALVLTGNTDPASGVWRVLHAALGFFFGAACVQLLVIGIHNLRAAGDEDDTPGGAEPSPRGAS